MHDPDRVVRSRVIDGQYFPIVVRTNKIAEEEQTRFSYFDLVQCFLSNFLATTIQRQQQRPTFRFVSSRLVFFAFAGYSKFHERSFD